MSSTAIVWFRHDLRLDDNPAWAAATSRHDRVVPIVVVDDRILNAAGAKRRSLWLAHVGALAHEIGALDGRLGVLTGEPEDVLPAAGPGVDSVYCNAASSPWGRRRDARVEAELAKIGVDMVGHWGSLVMPPGSVLTGKGTLSRVFTPFYKAWADAGLDPWPDAGPAEIIAGPTSLLPSADPPPHEPGSAAALDRLHDWLDSVDEYEETRDLPALTGTSRLSSDLRFGTLSPRVVLDLVGSGTEGRRGFVRQLAWRDWYAHLLIENPTMLDRSIRPEYDAIEWIEDPDGFEAWTEGRTGYPIVDAGMRQLAQTGWMHNRVRMITASFLVKDLLIDWRRGERWFRRLLIDAEPASNAGNWQWVAGTGPDAAPYFRVFNPVTQSRKFDGGGDYVRTWVPELAGLDSRAIHAPWEVPPLDLAEAGVVLGDTYPEPYVDHAVARDRTLAAYKQALGR